MSNAPCHRVDAVSPTSTAKALDPSGRANTPPSPPVPVSSHFRSVQQGQESVDPRVRGCVSWPFAKARCRTPAARSLDLSPTRSWLRTDDVPLGRDFPGLTDTAYDGESPLLEVVIDTHTFGSQAEVQASPPCVREVSFRLRHLALILPPMWSVGRLRAGGPEHSRMTPRSRQLGH
jgi:hypothetical protein